MAAIVETLVIFFLMYAAVIALYPIVFTRRRVIDERFHELAIDIHADEHPDANSAAARWRIATLDTR